MILDQLSNLNGVSVHAMISENIFCMSRKIEGRIYDDWLLLKSVKSATSLMLDAPLELPYEGVKEMLFFEHVNDRTF